MAGSLRSPARVREKANRAVFSGYRHGVSNFLLRLFDIALKARISARFEHVLVARINQRMIACKVDHLTGRDAAHTFHAVLGRPHVLAEHGEVVRRDLAQLPTKGSQQNAISIPVALDLPFREDDVLCLGEFPRGLAFAAILFKAGICFRDVPANLAQPIKALIGGHTLILRPHGRAFVAVFATRFEAGIPLDLHERKRVRQP